MPPLSLFKGTPQQVRIDKSRRNEDNTDVNTKNKRRDTMKRSLILLLLLAILLPLLSVNTLAAGSVEYTITSLTLSDPDTSEEFTSIPAGIFNLNATITPSCSKACTAVLFAWYDADGRMLGCESVEEPYFDLSTYRTTIDNTSGEISCIRAFVLGSGMAPLAASKAIENQVYNGSISGITVENGTVIVSAMADVDRILVVQILDEETGDVLWSGDAEQMTEDTSAELSVGIELPDYFVVTAAQYDPDGVQIGNAYTCLDYTRGFAEFQSKTEDDYAPDRIIDVAEEDDGNFAVLSADVIRLTQSPVSEGADSYTFSADEVPDSLKAGDKISFRNGDGVYTTIRINSVTLSGGTVTVTVDETAGIADLYDVIKINASIVARAAEENGGAVYSFAASAAGKPKDSGLFSGIEMGSAIKNSIETSFGSLEAELRAGGHVVAYYDPAIWDDDYLRVDVLTKMSLEGDLFIGGVTGISEEYLLFPEVSLAGLEVIGHIPLKLTGEFEIDCQAGLDMHLSAEVGAGYTYNTTDGVQKHSYKEITPGKLSSTGEAECSVEVEVGLRFSVGVELLDDLISATVGVGAGLGVDGEIEAAITPDSNATEYHACDLCMGGQCYAYLNADLNMHYQISEKLEGDLLDVEIIRAEWTIGKVYLSLLNESKSIHKGEMVFGWGECPNKKYLVTFVTYNNGTQEFGHTVTVTDSAGRTVASGSSTLKAHLYPAGYTAEAEVETNKVQKSFTVSEAMVVSLYAEDFVLSGTVIDKETGEALSGVTVMVLQEGEIRTSAVTDGSGYYSFTLPGGTYTVSFVMEGYQSYVVSLPDQQNDRSLNAALEPIRDPGILTGTVTDEATGEAVAMAKVMIRNADGEPVAVAGVNGSGQYTVELEAGLYTAAFSAENYESRTVSDISVEEKETAVLNVTLKRNQYILSGTVTEADSDPLVYISGAVVTASVDGEVKGSAVTDGSGSYRMVLPSGEYDIQVSADGYESASGSVDLASSDGQFSTALKKYLGSGQCGPELYWTLSHSGLLRIYGEGEMYDYNTLGDGKAEFYPPWGEYRKSILKIVVEEGTTTIGSNAFGLYRYDAFYKVSSVSLPDTLISIGYRAFRGCGKGAFNYHVTLTSITIPKNVETIGEEAFYQCETLVNVSLPDGLKSIGAQAFRECGLTGIHIPDTVTEIGKRAFYACKSLAQIHLPASLTELSEGLLENCWALDNFTIPFGVTTVGKEAFSSCKALTSIVLPDSVTTVSESAFSTCEKLSSVTLSKNLQGKLGDQAFQWCTSLSSIIIPEGVTYLGTRCFKGCTSLTSIVLPSSLKGFNWSGVFDQTGLTDIYYAGTAEQWAQISELLDEEFLKNVTVHFNYRYE